jgi:hypothetical protein
MRAVILNPGQGFACGHRLGQVSEWCRMRGIKPVAVTYDFQPLAAICVEFRLDADAEAFAEAFAGNTTTAPAGLRFKV